MAATLGVMVAGGRGARLGLGTPKALALLGGATLLDRGLAILAQVCDAIVVSAPSGLTLPLLETVSSACGEKPLARAFDPPGTVGPLAGIVAGLSTGRWERAIVLGADLPFVVPAALEGMLALLPGCEAVIPAPGGIPQPLAAAYAPAAAGILAARLEAGERYLLHAIRSLDARVLDDRALEDLPGGAAGFFNLNTPSDLAEAGRRLASRAAR